MLKNVLIYAIYKQYVDIWFINSINNFKSCYGRWAYSVFITVAYAGYAEDGE